MFYLRKLKLQSLGYLGVYDFLVSSQKSNIFKNFPIKNKIYMYFLHTYVYVCVNVHNFVLYILYISSINKQVSVAFEYVE